MSRSERSAILILSLCAGIPISLRQHYLRSKGHVPKTVEDMCARLDHFTERAFKAYPSIKSERELQKMQQALGNFQALSIGETPSDITVVTSLCLGVLEDMMNLVKHPTRYVMLGMVRDSIWKVHRYYDRQINKDQSYTEAEQAIKTWYGMVA